VKIQLIEERSMRMRRLRFGAGCVAAIVMAASPSARAQDYPTKPVTFITPAAAGNSPDVVTRVIADRLTQIWKQQIVVLNRPGAGGLIAAHRLCLISTNEFDRRVVALLGTLGSLSLYRGELPNKVYNTKTAEKVNYGNKPGEIGFSALDLGRLLIWLRILREYYPEHGNAADRVVMRWNFCHVVDACGIRSQCLTGVIRRSTAPDETCVIRSCAGARKS